MFVKFTQKTQRKYQLITIKEYNQAYTKKRGVYANEIKKEKGKSVNKNRKFYRF